MPLKHAAAGGGLAFRPPAQVLFTANASAREDLDRLPPDWLREARAMREGLLMAGVRRGLDVVTALMLLVLTLPLMLLTALAIRLDSPGPVFYRQERVGKDGRVFTLYK